MKIGILAHSYIPVSGGIQTYIHAKAVEFVKQGHPVHVIVPHNGLGPGHDETIDGVHIHRTSVENIDWSYPVLDNSIGGWTTYDNHQRWGAQVTQMVMEALPLIKKNGIQLVHTHFTATFVGELLHLFHGIPYVDSIYGFYTDYQPSDEMKEAARIFYQRGHMNKVIVVGNHVRNQCIRGGISESLLEVVYPSVDFDRFRLGHNPCDPVQKYGLPIKRTTAVIISPIRLQERKGFGDALFAFARVQERLPDSHLIITGGSSANPAGVEKPLRHFEEICAELSIAENVSLLLNKIPDSEMPAFYALADVVFMPSLQEGFGIANLEAMSMKKPIVATSIPPFLESTAGYARFFSPGDRNGAAEALLESLSLSDEIHDQVEQAYRHVRQTYDAQRLAKQMLDIYEETLLSQN